MVESGTLRDVMIGTIRKGLLVGCVGDVTASIQIPVDYDLNEWLAANTLHFYNAACFILGTTMDICTLDSCTVMNAGPNFEFLWLDPDSVLYNKPTKVSASLYNNLAFDWIEKKLSDPVFFPTNGEFPLDFRQKLSPIFKRLFRMYAHLYHSHFKQLKEAHMEATLNLCFKHISYFIINFNLLTSDDLLPMKRLIERFKKEDEIVKRDNAS